MKTLLLLLFITIFSIPSIAKDGFVINFNTKNIIGKTIELSFYYGSSKIFYSKDVAAILTGEENVQIRYDKKIFGGIYKLNIFGKKESINIIIENGDSLSFSLDSNSILDLKVLNSEKNKDFISITKNLTEDKIAKFIKKHPNSVGSLYFQLEKKRKFYSLNAVKRKFHQDNFWDSIDLNNPQLKFMPNIYKTINYYNKLIPINEVSYSNAMNGLLEKVDVTSENFEYYLSYYFQNMNFYKNINLDYLYINTYKKYMDTLKFDFKNLNYLRAIENIYDNIAANPRGEIITDHIFLDLKDSAQSLSSIYKKNDFTFLAFYDPDCSHCKKAMPKLVTFFAEFESDTTKSVKAIGMINAISLDRWRLFINTNNMKNWVNLYSNDPNKAYQEDFNSYSNPKFFLLDKEGKVLSRSGVPSDLKKIIADK